MLEHKGGIPFGFHMVKFKETAPRYSPETGGKYGLNAKLPPGLYNLDPRQVSGDIILQGDPVYTTPGGDIGNVRTPEGNIRGEITGTGPIGPHPGSESEGFPLLTQTPEGEQKFE